MTQDAARLAAFLLFATFSGCASPGKHVPPTKPLKPYVPESKTTTPGPVTVKPDGNSNFAPKTVTGGSAMTPPAPVVLPGAQVPAMGIPTLPTTTSPVVAQSSPDTIKTPAIASPVGIEGILPPTPPRMPTAAGAPTDLSVMPIVAPVSGVVDLPK